MERDCHSHHRYAGEWVFMILPLVLVMSTGLESIMDGCMQKEFVDPSMSMLALPAGKAILPLIIEAVAVARERGLFVVWVSSLSFGNVNIWFLLVKLVPIYICSMQRTLSQGSSTSGNS